MVSPPGIRPHALLSRGPTQHPHPLQRTPSRPGLPLPAPKMRSCPLRLCLRPPAGGWGQASCFPRAASCFAHQEAALAPVLEPLLGLGCSVAARLGQGLGAVNSSGPRQPPLPPAASPKPCRNAPPQDFQRPQGDRALLSHPHHQLLPLPAPHDAPCPQVTPGDRKVQRDKRYRIWNNNNSSCHQGTPCAKLGAKCLKCMM